MMRTMRENAKWVFYILAIAFVGWMVFDVGMGITGQGQYGVSDVVIKVDGDEIRAQEFQTAVSNAFEAYRQQAGNASLTREDEEALQNRVVDDLIRQRLLRREYERLGISVSDREVIEAARTAPLPELLEQPELQTDGNFDMQKYLQLLNTDEQLRLYVEARYRDQIPQIKLAQYLTADVYVSDAKLWRMWRDRTDSVTAVVVSLRPEMVPDEAAAVSDDEVAQYYEGHREDFKRTAVAYLSFVALPRMPDASDTAAARARVERIRAEVVRGGADVFAEVARRESADSGSAVRGGDLGWVPRTTPPFVRPFTEALRALRPGQVSPPVLTEFGYHVARLAEATRDSLRASHILVPIELQAEHLDRVETRADSLDRLAAEAEGVALDSAARTLGLPLAPAPPLREGERMQLGRWVIADVSVWAFEVGVGETSPVIEASPAYYVFRLDSLVPAGVPPLAEIRETVLAAARGEKKRVVARQRGLEALTALRAEPSLAAAAAERGLPVETRTFTRPEQRGALQDEPLVVGAAFGLRVGERSGVIEGRRGYYIVESLARRGADSTAWVAQREEQRRQVVEAARQARMRLYVDDLRERAEIVDRRKELARQAAEAPPGS